LAGVQFTKTRSANLHKFATGTRDNMRAYTSGPVIAGGQAKLPVSADELVEWLLLGVAGGVTPTTPTGATLARLWSFTPSTSLDAATIERNDGANLFRLWGTRVNKMTIAGSVGGANDATLDWFAQNREDNWAGPLTGALSSRTPTFMEGWQTRLWLANFNTSGAVPPAGANAALLPPCLINWEVMFDGGLGRKFTAANTKAAYSVTLGELTITAKLSLEASVAAAVTELTNWNNDTKRLLTLEFLGPADEIEAGANEVQLVTITGTPTGGTFTLTFAGQTTAPIAFNATAAAVASALNALTNVGIQSGNTNVAASGGPLPGTAVTVTFQNDLGTQGLPLMTANSALLTGGASPTATPSRTTAGRSGRRYFAIDLPGAWISPDANQSDAGTRIYTVPLTYVFDTTQSFGVQFRTQNARTAAY
jgi:hypothetical protein